MVDNLIECWINKPTKLDFTNRFKAIKCKPDSSTYNCRLCQRCIKHTLFTKFFYKTLSNSKYTTVNTYIFSNYKNSLIFFHFLMKRKINRFSNSIVTHKISSQTFFGTRFVLSVQE